MKREVLLRLLSSSMLLFSSFLAIPTANKDVSALPPPIGRAVDFTKDIQPIFANNCYKCHGAEKKKNGLRLDLKAEALNGGDSGPAIVPGKSVESLLVHLVAGLDEDKAMPPKGERLTAEQIGLLRAWIDQGAKWPDGTTARAAKSDHWSFKTPVRPSVPRVKDKRWVRNEIDAFVLARLEKEGIKPSPEADKTTLIRRLSLDLTGLPPNPAEIEAILNDKHKDAYEQLVERLLSSPHFGEQWARHWLDLARYADTDGYEKDFYRPHAWRWRDWVIDSINRDQRFDEFTRDQIAGDLLPNATLEQRVATGFHRNTLLNREGGVDVEEDRCKIVVDRVNTVGTAWLGLTVGCAECHSHKYDPITQREYYQLYAFFNSADDRDIHAPLPAKMTSVTKLETELEKAKHKYVAGEDPDLESWATQVAALPDIWFTPKHDDYDLPTFGANNGANLYHQEDGSFLVTGMVDGKCHYIMMLNTKVKGITGIRVEPMTDEMLPRLGPGWATNGNFVLNELYVETASLKDVSNLKRQAVEKAVADYSQPGFPIEATIDGDHDKGGWAVDMPHLAMAGVDRCAVLTLKDDLGYGDEGMRLKVSLVQHEGRSHTLGRVRVSYTTAPRDQLAAQAVPQRIRDIAKIPRPQRSLEQQTTLRRYYQSTFRTDSPELAAFTKQLAESPGVKGEVEAQTLVERKTPRPTHLHVRGDFLNKGAEVQPGTLVVLHPFKARGAKADRIDLANWLMDPANPLTARVTVNHIWANLFGDGLVSTVDDFGTQGEKPSQPELLDWLATEFVKRGGSRKEMIKLIVMSSTYRQSSDMREELLQRDAKNKLLARQNRFRLSAENARDQCLVASGLLDGTIGGPSVTADSRRRGLYLQFRRSFPEYMLTTFDAPSTTFSCPRRERSNTPLQALTLLNDPVFVQCAQALARRVVAAKPAQPEERMRLAFKLCVGRVPSTEEVADLRELFDKTRKIYFDAPEPAINVASKPALRDLPAPEAAAWTVVARTILNLDELITRE